MYMSVKNYADVQKAYEEHESMLEAVKNNDMDKFVKLYEEHIRW